MTVLLWPVVVITLGILLLMLLHETVGRYFAEKHAERLNVTQHAQVETKIRSVLEEVAELREAINRLEMREGLK